MRFNKENQDYVSKKKKDELNKKNNDLKKKFKETAQLINKKLSLFFNKECKENGELYGSIKPKEISNTIMSKIKTRSKTITNCLKRKI